MSSELSLSTHLSSSNSGLSSNDSRLSPRGLTAGSRFLARKIHFQKIIEKLFLLQEIPQIDRWLSLEFAKNKKFGSQDRKWYSEQVFFFVRYMYLILYLAKYQKLYCAGAQFTPASSIEFKKFSDEINTPQKLWNAIKKLSFEEIDSSMNSILQSSAQDTTSSLNSEDAKNLDIIFLNCSVPLWLKPNLMRSFNELYPSEIKYFLELQNTRPLLWIRLNHIDKREDVLTDLSMNEFVVQTYENQKMLSLVGIKSVYQLDSFKKGLFEVQDYASQEIGNALEIKPGDYVWDACAGGGGKTMQIASALNNKGVVYATDIREYKLEEIKKRAKRGNFFNVRTLVWDGVKLPLFPKEIQNKKGFNFILVDAPCSASGTWRRHPDAKYKTNDKTLLELTQLQLGILSAVPSALKSGGKLLYATCSVFKEENEDIVHKFLQRHSNFKIIKMKTLNSPTNDSDRMFVAVLEKTEGILRVL